MKNNIFYIIFVLGILVLSRIIPHPPNFTPILGTAIMAPTLFKDKTLGIFVVIGITTAVIAGLNTYKNFESPSKKIETKVKKEIKILFIIIFI